MEQYHSKTLDDLMKNFAVVLANYVNIFIEILDNFFRDRDILVSNFAKKAYVYVNTFLFQNFPITVMLAYFQFTDWYSRLKSSRKRCYFRNWSVSFANDMPLIQLLIVFTHQLMFKRQH